jgi:hypothetical protein
MEYGVKAAAAGMGLSSTLSGRNPPAYQADAMKSYGQDIQSGPSLIGAAADYFPYTGYIRSFGEYANAAQSVNPLEQMARYTITGDRGSGIDLHRMIEKAAREQGGIPPGSLSPNGGTMPARPYQFPQGYSFPPTTVRPNNTLGGVTSSPFADTLARVAGGAPATGSRDLGADTYGIYTRFGRDAQPNLALDPKTLSSYYTDNPAVPGHVSPPGMAFGQYVLAHEYGHYFEDQAVRGKIPMNAAPWNTMINQQPDEEAYADNFAQAIQNLRTNTPAQNPAVGSIMGILRQRPPFNAGGGFQQ